MAAQPDDIDEEVLYLVAQLIDSDPASAGLVQKLWSDREKLFRALEYIRDWDMMNAEARSLQGIDAFIARTLAELGE